MLQHREQFERLKLDVLLVTFDSQQLAKNYKTKFGFEWPVILDPDKQLYRQFGFERASTWTLIRPDVFLRYLWVMMTGFLPGKAGKDLHQLGGDILLNDNGDIAIHVASENPHDRPSPQQIIDAVKLSL